MAVILYCCSQTAALWSLYYDWKGCMRHEVSNILTQQANKFCMKTENYVV